MLSLVTGAAGHIGGAVVRALLARGLRVRAAVHGDRRPLAGLPVDIVSLDILERAAVGRVLTDVDTVYHCAGRIAIRKSTERGMWETNVEGTRVLAESALAAGVKRFIHFSSIHALQSAPENEPVDEDRPLVDGRSPMLYDLSKAAGERIMQDAVRRGLPAVIVNPTAVIGPPDFKPSLLGEFLVLLAGGRLPGLVKGGFDWVDVRDVAAGAIAAGQKGRVGERYILSGTWESVSGLAGLVEKAIGRKVVKRVFPAFLARLGLPFLAFGAVLSGRRTLYTHDSLGALSHYRRVSSRKAREELCYRPRPLADTLADTIAWFAENGYLSRKG